MLWTSKKNCPANLNVIIRPKWLIILVTWLKIDLITNAWTANFSNLRRSHSSYLSWSLFSLSQWHLIGRYLHSTVFRKSLCLFRYASSSFWARVILSASTLLSGDLVTWLITNHSFYILTHSMLHKSFPPIDCWCVTPECLHALQDRFWCLTLVACSFPVEYRVLSARCISYRIYHVAGQSVLSVSWVAVLVLLLL